MSAHRFHVVTATGHSIGRGASPGGWVRGRLASFLRSLPPGWASRLGWHGAVWRPWLGVARSLAGAADEEHAQ